MSESSSIPALAQRRNLPGGARAGRHPARRRTTSPDGRGHRAGRGGQGP